MASKQTGIPVAHLFGALLGVLVHSATVHAQPSVSVNPDGSLAVDASEPGAGTARAIAAATGFRIDGIEHLDGTVVTLRFQQIRPVTVLQLLAEEGGSLLMRSGEHFAFATPAQAAKLRAAFDAVEAAQASGDTAALDAALPSLLALLRPSASGPAFIGHGYWNTASARAEERGDLAASEALAREQLAHIERLEGGKSGAEYGLALAGVARLRALQDDNEVAIALYERGIEVAAQALGPAHPELARPQMFLGNRYREAGHELAAERAYLAAIASFDAGGQANDIWLASTLDALAGLYLSRQRPRQAVPLYERSLAVQQAIYGEGSPATSTVLFLLADALWQADRLPRAAEVLTELVAIGGDRRSSRAAASRLAAIQALGPFADPATEPDPGRVAALRRAFAADASGEARFHAQDLLAKRAAAAFRSDPDSRAGTRACTLYAEVALAMAGPARTANTLGRERERCRATATAEEPQD